VSNHRTFDGARLFRGKVPHKHVPEVPTPPLQEEPVIEREIVNDPDLDYRPVLVKPKEKIKIPHYNTLYDSVRSNSAWDKCADLWTHGSLAFIGQGVTSAPVTITVPGGAFRLAQWPGALQVFLVLRSFSVAPSYGLPGQNFTIPATAGAAAIFTGQGILTTVIVTATGASNLILNDGNGGNVIGFIPSTATVGQAFTFNMPFLASLWAQKSATTPVVSAGVTIPAVAVEYLFQDTSGNTIPLGESLNQVGLSFNVSTLLPSPITDPGTVQVGTLSVNIINNPGAGITYNYAIGFSLAYLLPQLDGYDIKELPQRDHYFREY
jgi:hypothetical protein